MCEEMAFGIIVIVNKFVIVRIEFGFDIFQVRVKGLGAAITRLEEEARSAVRVLGG
jgi:hypothetical protein